MSDSEGKSGSVEEPKNRLIRITHKHRLETKLRNEWKVVAREQCASVIKLVAECRDREGFWAGFNCKKELKVVQDCLRPISTDEVAYATFKARRIREIYGDRVEMPQ